MRKEKSGKGCKYDNVHRVDPVWLDSICEDKYGPKEKSTVRKVMVPISSIVKLWKRMFR